MALVLSRRNGAPLGGALFVSNPSRKTRRAAAKKRRSSTSLTKRRAAPKRRNIARKRRTSSVARKRNGTKRVSAATRRKISLGVKRANRRNAVALRTNRKRRSTVKRRSTRRNAVALRSNPKRRSVISRSRRRNAIALRSNAVALRANRSRRRSRRRNSASSASLPATYSMKLLAPIQRLAKKVPVIGKTVAMGLAPLAFGAVAGAVHVYGMRLASRYAPGVYGKIAPVGYSVGGLVVAGLLLAGGKIPLLNKVPAAVRKQVASAALVSGGALDAFRYFQGTSSDFAGISEYSGSHYGDGMAYDVVPVGGLSEEYSGSQPVDAAACPADLSVEEGEAALAGPGYWKQYFGPPPQRVSGGRSPYSNLAGREGHRWGWLINMIGFERFSKIAAMPPQNRVELLANLKGHAIQIADQQIAQSAASTVPDTSGLALDMNGTLFAGAM